MDKNLQNIDDIFNRAYNSYEEDPSPAAWQKLNAALDKADAEKYKRHFISWKRIAVIFLLLLSGVIIYETSVIIKRNKEVELIKKKSTTDTIFAASDPKNFKTWKGKKEGDPQNNGKPIAEENKSPDVSHEVNRQNKLTSKQEKYTTQNKSNNNVTVKLTTTPQHHIKSSITKEQKVIDNKIDQNQHYITEINKKDFIRRILLAALQPVDKLAVPSNSIIKLSLSSDTKSTASITKLKKKKIASSFIPYWSVTGFASNDWGQYKLDNDVPDNTGNQQNEKEEINNREKHEGSFSAGLFVTRQFNKFFGIKTGLIYSNTNIGISPQEIYAAKKTDGSVAYKYITSSGYGFVTPGFGMPPSVGDSILSTEAQHNLQVISIPVMVSYKLQLKKFSIAPSVGLSANLITSATIKTEVKDALNKEAVTINGLDGMKHFFTGLVADVNLQYNYNSKLSFSLLPGFKYALSPITKGNVVKTFPYSFNIGGGITYKF